MEFKWVVEESIIISDFDFKFIIHMAKDFMREDYTREEAITAAVRTYITGQDDNYAAYTITHEVFNQIKNEVNKRFT